MLKGAAASAGEALARTTTDGDGSFELALAARRWVRVVASLAGRATVGTPVAGPGALVRLVLPAAVPVEVRVVDERDAPVPDARVEAFAREAVLVAATDGAGAARFDDVAPGALSITVEAAGGRRARAGPVTIEPSDVRTLTVLLPSAVTVEGVVLAADTGLPVAGAEVHAAQPGLAFAAEPTGPDGAFGPVAAGAAHGRVTLAVRAPGYAPRMLAVRLQASDGPQRLPPVLLQPAPDWRGRVVDAGGHAVAGARVTWTAAGIAGREPPEVRTDEAGRFTLPPPSPPAPGRRVVLTAEATAGSAALALRPGAPPPADLVLVLAGGHAVTGRVVSPDGEPLGGVSVRLEPRWSEIDDRRQPGPETARLLALGETARLALTTATDAGGWWHIGGVPDGVYDARLVHLGSTDFLDGPVAVAGADADAGLARFGDGHPLEGTTTDESGRALAGVEVTLREAEGHPRIRRVVSDADGAWRLAGVPAGSWRLVASRPDRSPLALEVAAPAPGPLDLALGRGSRLAGRVLDAQGGPYDGVFQVRLEGPTGRDPGPGGVFRDAEGRFLIDGVPPGTWTARVETPRGALGATPGPVEVRPGATFDVTITLDAGAVLAGTLRDAGGRAVVGGRVAATHDTRRVTQTAVTTAGGAFRIAGLEAGRWRLVAHGGGGAPVLETADLGAAEVRTLDLVLGPVSTVEVTVRGEDGSARAGAYVLVRPAGSPATRPDRVPRTDAAGRVVLADVPLGTVVFEARLRSGESGRAQVEVTGDGAQTVDVRVRRPARPDAD